MLVRMGLAAAGCTMSAGNKKGEVRSPPSQRKLSRPSLSFVADAAVTTVYTTSTVAAVLSYF